jgi:branched-chain amino acid transport system substrate-binding protein
MNSLPSTPFAILLRRHRQARGLTQEELAERAHLSPRAIGALEQGTRQAPRRETLDLLAEALDLTEPERAAFEAAARHHRLATLSTSAAPEPTAPAQPSGGDPPLLSRLRTRALAVYRGLPARPALPARLRDKGKLVASVFGLMVLGTGLLAGRYALSRGGTLCLATDFPASGNQAPTRSVEFAADLAVAQHQDLGQGYTLKVLNYDDASPLKRDADPQIGARNIQQIVRAGCVVGMVGPGNSDVAAAEMPIAANAGLVMVSPDTTLSGLTLRPYAALDGYDFDQMHPSGKPLNFFRVVPNDVAQGVAAANFLFDQLGARTVYVVTDRKQFGEDLLGGFTQGLQFKGGSIQGVESIPSANLSAVADIAARIVKSNPDAVFYAGLTEDGGALLRAQLVKRGYLGAFLGSEGIAGDPSFVELAGVSAANGSWAISPSAQITTVTSRAAAQFIHDYAARYPSQRLDPTSAEAYDAAMVLISGIKHLIQAGRPVTRAALLEQVQRIQYSGIIGPINFDSNGDIAHGVFSVWQVRDGVWTCVQPLRL